MSHPSHLDLLDMARALQRAAVDDDLDGLHGGLCRLRTSLIEHLHDEGPLFEGRDGSAGSIVRNGQRRLLDLLDGLLSVGRDDRCTCMVRAAEVEAALRRQARLEAAVLRSFA